MSAAKKASLRRGVPPGKRDYLSDGFPERLRRARLGYAFKQGKEVSVTDVGAIIGIVGYTVNRYEAGQSEPTLPMIERLAGVLGVTPEWLAFGVGDHPSEQAERPPLVRAPTMPIVPARTPAQLKAERERASRKHG